MMRLVSLIDARWGQAMLVGACIFGMLAVDRTSAAAAEADDPRKLLDQYCISCHDNDTRKGELSLEALVADDLTRHAEVWENVLRRLDARQMPPADRKRRPSEAAYEATIASLSRTLDAAAAAKPNPGRTPTLRRLTRTEYANAIRDLLGVEVDAAAILPPDEVSHGFDNITVTDLSPTLLESYIAAAQKISRLALAAPRPSPDFDVVRVRPDLTQEQHLPGLPLGSRGGVLIPHHFPQTGEYEIAIRLSRDRNEHIEGLKEPHEMELLLDRARVADFKVAPPKGTTSADFNDDQLKARVAVTAGRHDLAVTFIPKGASLEETARQPFNAHFNFHRHPRLSPAVYQVSISGPYAAQTSQATDTRRRILIRYPSDATEHEACARDILAPLMQRAYRRPITESDLAQPMELFRQTSAEAGFEAGIEMALSAVLVNPNFLFRVERDPADAKPGQPYTISDIELASRLSFFLWSSMPDDALLDAAIRGELRKPGVLEGHVRRMLADPRAEALATNFADQWLHLRNLDSRTPDLRLYPDFDDNLRQAMRRETLLLFQHIMREDRSVLELLSADYTFLNERLAKHYDIPHVYGSRFRQVELAPEHPRGGILRHGSILTVTSYATRTSPVIRGKWILENILGTPPPPPPPDVPALKENVVRANLSVRERLAEHRANAACASCHDLIDPVGFALENFDAIGRWRTHEEGAIVDVSGGLPDGSEFAGIDGMERALLARPDLFATTMAQKLMTYALGRGVEPYDGPAIRAAVRRARDGDYRFSALIVGLVQSTPFQMRSAP